MDFVRILHLFDEKVKLLISVGVLNNSSAIVGICRIKHRFDSPLHQNAKPLPNSDLPQAGNGAYKPAYKQNRKVTSNEAQKLYPDLVGIVDV